MGTLAIRKGWGGGQHQAAPERGPPFISVIITAYKRREYLKRAVDSVLNQTLPRDGYEVVVTKNFEFDLDGEWSDLGVKLVFFDKPGLGARVADALLYCRGEVVCFLDDDDLWAPHKLEHVSKLFEDNPKLGYCRNSLVQFHGKAPIPDTAMGDISNQILINNPKGKRLVDTLPVWNNSSASIKKNILETWSKYLAKVELAIDYFLLVAAYMSNARMLFSPPVLTYVRKHEQNTTSLGVREFNASLSKHVEVFRRLSNDWALMEVMCKGTPFEEHCRRTKDYQMLHADIFAGSRNQVARSLVSVVYDTLLAARFDGVDRFQVFKLFLDPSSIFYRGVLSTIAPSYIRKLYFYHSVMSEQKKYKELDK
jgi:glycosyltransferase involved in cell wall biosynthesis